MLYRTIRLSSSVLWASRRISSRPALSPTPRLVTQTSPPSIVRKIQVSYTDNNIIQGASRLIPEQDLEQITRSQPLGRFGSVRDIADATVYLFSDAGSYVSGQTLVGKLTWDHCYHPPELLHTNVSRSGRRCMAHCLQHHRIRYEVSGLPSFWNRSIWRYGKEEVEVVNIL